MVFMFFLKDNVDFVIAIENNGIIVTGAFFRVFQRRISEMLCFKHFGHVCFVSLTPIIRLFEKDGMKINEELFA